MSEDQFFEQFDDQIARKRNRRETEARCKIERYREDRQLAGWINDYHFERHD